MRPGSGDVRGKVEDISDMVYWLGTSRAAGKFSGRDLGLDLGTLQQ